MYNRITPARAGWTSGRELARALNLKLVSFKRQPKGDLFINYGRGDVRSERCLNSPSSVVVAANKLNAFKELTEGGFEHCCPWTTDIAQARKWSANGKTVFVRHKLTGRSGAGIEIVEPGGDMPAGPLYTMYVGKRTEYRVHVIQDRVFVTQKKLRHGVEEKDFKVRSYDNGWVHAREEINCPPALENAAKAAILGLDLDFGAVDCAVTPAGKPYIFEVNTAPGITGQVFDFYVGAFKDIINEL